MADLLVVDDDIDVAGLMAELLCAEGHVVRVARNGAEGLILVAERHPDLVLLDVEMPVLTGPDMAYRMLLRDCGQENIPILLLSGIVTLPLVAARVGTPYFLAKPYTVDAVLDLMQRALRERTPPSPRLENGSHEALRQ